MEKFYHEVGFITGFVVLVVFLDMVLGEKFIEAFLGLVLFSMVILNAPKMIKLMKGWVS